MTREPTTQVCKELRRLHRELGSWRAVARQVGVPLKTVYDVAKKKKPLPASPRSRERLLAIIHKEATMNEQEAKVVHLLQTFHLGQARAIRLLDLLKEVYGQEAGQDRSKNNPYARELRERMEKINREHGGLICSNPYQGYWWAANLEEGLKVVGAHKHLGLMILDNAKVLELNLQRSFGGQLELQAEAGGAP